MPLVPRIVEVEHMRQVKKDLTSHMHAKRGGQVVSVPVSGSAVIDSNPSSATWLTRDNFE